MLAKSPVYSINPSWSHFTGFAVIFLSICIGIGRYVLFDSFDPIHCEALVRRGSWLDTGKLWQPDGCVPHQYTSKDASLCLSTRHVVFIGDSVTRRLFFQFAHLLDPSLPTAPQDDGKKHANHTLHATSGTLLSFYWDPFLNTTHTFRTVSRVASPQNSTSIYDSRRPVLLVMGGGLWNLRYSDVSGGLPAWEANIENLVHSVSTSEAAEKVVFLPVEEIISSKLSPDRAKTMHSSDIDAMNSDLNHRIYSLPGNNAATFRKAVPPSIVVPSVFNQMLEASYTQDGIHFSDSIVRLQANLLLNLQCNEKLPKVFPLDTTCCRRYPWPGALQLLTILAFALYGVWRVWRSWPAEQTMNEWLAVIDRTPAYTLCLTIVLIFLADRTGLWLKEQKVFSAWTFAFLNMAALAAGLATVKRSDKDLGFLNREQTDEWKGWMQVAILIYHYLGASKISGIYNPIRVLVASYLFMTGYGHTTFYIRKADFGFLRIVQVLLRLNFLTVVLAYTMNTNYLYYYFAPLVSFWFIVIYLTLAAGSRFNDRALFVAGKLLLSAGVVGLFMHYTWLLESIFGILQTLCGIHWSAKEWAFRVKLDLWIVYIGMFAALAVMKSQEHRLMDSPRWPLLVNSTLVVSGITMVWFFAFELSQESKFTYNFWHPYVSFLPVLAFAVLRNANAVLRSASSQFFAFIGRCSLETFIIQYHFWLAGDTKTILLVLPGTRWRPINFVLTSLMFVYVSNQVAHATGDIVTFICGEKPKLPTRATTEMAQLNVSSGQSNGENNAGSESRRWIDRLADGQNSASGISQFSTAWQPNLKLGMKTKLGITIGGMWILNLMWPHANP